MAVDKDRAQWEKNLRFSTRGVDEEDGSRYDFTIICNDKRFVVTKAQDEIEDIIYEAGWRTSLTIKYVTCYLAINVTSNLPRYSAQDILFTKKLMGTGYIAKVSVNGQDMCCKMLVPTLRKAVQREYECLKKIADSKYASSIKTPRLIGFVVNGSDDEGVIGILEEYIPHTANLGRFQRDIKAVPGERRRKWAEQVRRSVELLHEIGVVWGDGKPENECSYQ